MGTLTGTYFIEEAKLQLGETQSTWGAQQPMLYPQHLQRVCTEIARATLSVYRHAATGIVSGQDVYSIPYAPLQVRYVSYINASSEVIALSNISNEELNTYYQNLITGGSPVYTGIPKYWQIEGETNLKIYPSANFTTSYGLLVSAYWAVDQWWNQSTACPLPEWADLTVINGLAYYRCREMQSYDPNYSKILPSFSEPYFAALKDFRAQMETATSDRRGGPAPTSPASYGTIASGWEWVS